MNHHIEEEELILHYYGEAENAIAVERHMVECDACRAEYQRLQRVLNTVDSAPVPERAVDYGDQVWRRLVPQVRRSRWRAWLSPRRWAPAAAVAALVLCAFLLGRYSPRPGGPVPDTAQQRPVRERVLLVAVGDHLERSQIILAELVNTGASGSIDIAGEREIAESLVEANRLYRQTATATGDAGVARVLEDLERVLLEIAHSPDKLSGPQLDELRHRIESQGLLFKVRVIGSHLREDKSQTTL